jgi:proline dehydrogenase
LLAEVADRARRGGIRLHFDSLWPETAEPTRQTIEQLRDKGCGSIGYTLATRWKRCLEDARWASERQLYVRVVKGQWPCPQNPNVDLRKTYLSAIDQLAGRARFVAVGSHDAPLAREALGRLRQAGTPCELELLHGLPMRKSLAMAREMGVAVRVYVPFGRSHLPYAVGKAMKNPRMIWWLARDLVGGV